MTSATNSLPRIALLATGGTIAGQAQSDGNYRAGSLEPAQLLAALPQVGELLVPQCETLFALDSKDITPAHWLQLAAHARRCLQRADLAGLVITHGTDTLEESAYFLSLCLPRSKPVLLAAAMRPAGMPSADGPLNLLQALAAARQPELAACGPLIVANDRLWAARHFTKRDSRAVDALGSFNAAPLGRLHGLHAELEAGAAASTPVFGTALPASLPRVDIIAAYAGASPALLEASWRGGARGIVLALAGHGSVPQAWQAALNEACAAGVVVLRASRAPSGGVMPGANFDDAAAGTFCAGALNAWQARVLLMLALAHGVEGSALAALLAAA